MEASHRMNANEKQVAGTHYKGEYQHWDFVVDTEMPYLLGCATKYLTRWKKKNGIEDLKKCIHYIEKAKETETYLLLTPEVFRAIDRFTSTTFTPEQWEVKSFNDICTGRYQNAINDIVQIIEERP
jgi:hypothetical protein